MSVNEKLRNRLNDQLFEAILSLDSMEECYEFFEDICTVNELRSLAQRLEVARMLKEGVSYEKIVAVTGASTATISRVKRCLVYGADGYKKILARQVRRTVSRSHLSAARPWSAMLNCLAMACSYSLCSVIGVSSGWYFKAA